MLAQLVEVTSDGLENNGPLIHLGVACLMFVLAHRVVSGSAIRARLAKVLGESRFRRSFALLSAALFAWLVWAYVLCGPSGTIRLDTALQAILWFAGSIGMCLIVLGVTTVNPTIAGMARRVHDAHVVHGVLRITRHPFLIGVALVSLVHLVMKPFLAECLFLGTIIFVALAGTLSIDKKRNALLGADWQAFANQTSILPFAAVLRGRQRVKWREFRRFQIVGLLVALASVSTGHAIFL